MTDLQINIALAQAMGWEDDDISSSFYSQNLEAYDWDKNGWRKFDYRDPVIFTAICKHWNLVANFEGFVSGVAGIDLIGTWQRDCIEKAAALTVIELAKRGIK